MPKPGPHEALIYIMVVMSAADRDMTDGELGRIGEVVRTWPVFVDFDEERLLRVASDCQRLVQEDGGLDRVFSLAAKVLPERLHDTAYALAFEVAAVDLEMRLEELRVLQFLRRHLNVDTETVASVERAAKARHRTLT